MMGGVKRAVIVMDVSWHQPNKIVRLTQQPHQHNEENKFVKSSQTGAPVGKLVLLNPVYGLGPQFENWLCSWIRHNIATSNVKLVDHFFVRLRWIDLVFHWEIKGFTVFLIRSTRIIT
jgi:hypothetical protein